MTRPLTPLCCLFLLSGCLSSSYSNPEPADDTGITSADGADGVDGTDGTTTPPPGLSYASRDDDGDPATPELQIQGANASVAVYKTGATGLSEVHVQSSDGTVDVRTFFDPDTGMARLFHDGVSGNTTVMMQDDASAPSQYYYLTFAADGSYVDGYAAWVDGEDLRLAHIEGTPSFTGQLFAQLSDTTTGQTGSFAVTAATASNVATPVGLLITEDEQVVPRGALIFAEGIRQLDGTASLDASGLVPKALQVAGVLGLVAAASAAAGGAAVAGAGAYAAMAVGAFIMSGFSNDIANEIEEKFGDDDEFVQSTADIVVDYLRDPNGTGIIEAIGDGIETVRSVFDGEAEAEGPVDDVWGSSSFDDLDPSSGSSTWDDVTSRARGWYDSASDAVGTLTDEVHTLIDTSSEDVSLDGLAVFQDGTPYDLEGTVDPARHVELSGEDLDGGGTTLTIEGDIDEDGNFNGTFEIDTGGLGIAYGEVTEVGDCSSAVGSGGEGTFTFAHYVGVGPGTSSFFYDAYSIPDAFTVTGSGGRLFSTGGLVSGSGTESLSVSDTGPATLFVSVSAPRSGTAWEYALGCIDDASTSGAE